jgi:hypothetical protein
MSLVDEDEAIARRQGIAKRQGLAVWAWRQANLVGAKHSDGGVHQVDGIVVERLAPDQVARTSDQVAAQEGGDEAVGVPEAVPEARVRDVAAQVAAQRTSVTGSERAAM